jgi:HlyD family secretion protein
MAGKVRMVAPTVDPATRNGLVYVDLPQAGGGAKAGMFARGEFELGTQQRLTLPQSAVLLRDGFSYVFKVGADNKVRSQGAASAGGRRPHRDHRRPGRRRRVVAAGGGFLADGDTVRVVVRPGRHAAQKTAPAL